MLRRLLLVLLQELEQVPVPLLVQEQVLLPELEQVLPLLLVQAFSFQLDYLLLVSSLSSSPDTPQGVLSPESRVIFFTTRLFAFAP